MEIIIISKKHGKKILIIDDNDFDKISKYTWNIDRNQNIFYAKTNIRINGKQIKLKMHRFIMGAVRGQQIDHINGNGLDNRKCNLRFCTIAENRRNVGRQKNNTSGYKGVYFNKRRGKYSSEIMADSKKIFLGYFTTIEEAYAAYCEAAKKYHGKFARIA